MPAIPRVSLAVDGETGLGATPAGIGSPSSALADATPYLVFARGNCRATGAGSAGDFATLDLEIGGVAWARLNAAPSFGSPSFGAVDSAQLAAVFLVADGDGDAMEFVASDVAADGAATSCRAHALDVSGIPANDGRWHAQTANSDTVVDTPPDGSDWTALVADRGGTNTSTALTFTPPRTGPGLAISCVEVVIDPSADDGDRVTVRQTVDGTAVDGNLHDAGAGAGGSGNRLLVIGLVFFTNVDLVASTPITIGLQANGAVGATDGNGLISYRRIRHHVIEGLRIEDGDIVVDTGSGATVASTEVEDVAGLSVTMDPPAEVDYLVLGHGQGQFSAWPRAFLRAGSTNYPTDGAVNAAAGTGAGAGDDMTSSFLVDVVPDVSSSTALGIRVEAGAGTTGTWGEDAANAGAGVMRVAAIRLAVPSSGELLEGSGESIADTADTAAGVTIAPASASSTADTADTCAPIRRRYASASSDAPSIGRASIGGVPSPPPEIVQGETMSSTVELLRTGGDTVRLADLPTAVSVASGSTAAPISSANPAATARTVAVGGFLQADADITLTFYSGDPDTTGVLIGTANVSTGVPFYLGGWCRTRAGERIYIGRSDAAAIVGSLDEATITG